MPDSKRYLIYGLLVITAITVVVLMVEAGLRLFAPIHLADTINVYRYDPVLGTRLKANLHDLSTSDYQRELITNRHGSVNFRNDFTRFDTLIFAAGDSYTQGTGLPPDAAYPFQLSQFLNGDSGRYRSHFAVVNLGLAAYGLEQTMLAIREYAEIYGSPNFILFLGCDNDYRDDQKFEQGQRHDQLVDGNPNWGIWLKPMQWFTNRTEIGKRLKLLNYRMRLRGTVKNRRDAQRNQETRKPRISIAQRQEARLTELVALSDSLNAQLIVSWSTAPQFTPDSYHWLKGWAAEHEILFADWHPEAIDVMELHPDLPFFNPHSGGHYRTWVNQTIANAYGRAIHDRKRAKTAKINR